jgi:hypothetical protein
VKQEPEVAKAPEAADDSKAVKEARKQSVKQPDISTGGIQQSETDRKKSMKVHDVADSNKHEEKRETKNTAKEKDKETSKAGKKSFRICKIFVNLCLLTSSSSL